MPLIDHAVWHRIDLASAQRLGLAYSTGRGLREHLRSLGFDDARLQSSGLFTERGERFTGMIIVPEELVGRVHWLAGRAISPDAKQRFTPLPGPKPVLGLDRLPEPSSWIVVTEGLFDWLALASGDVPSVAALGTQGLEKVARSLQGQARVFLTFDSDADGNDASTRLQALIGEHRSSVVTLPDGFNDIGDLATLHDGRTFFLHLLRRAALAR